MTANTERTVREIVLADKETVRIFESAGIDYCCGGNVPLKDACLRANVSEESVLKLLENLASARRGQSQPDEWLNAPFAELTAHIVNRHHQFVRTEGPRLLALFGKVVTRHGEAHPELIAIRELFTAVFQELSTHMLKEEQVLFPYLNSLDEAVRGGKPAPAAFFGSVRNPIARMLEDHDDAGALLARISTLSSRYQTPSNACLSYTALYHGLAEFERDLHQHVHLENNILFSRAVEIEKAEN